MWPTSSFKPDPSSRLSMQTAYGVLLVEQWEKLRDRRENPWDELTIREVARLRFVVWRLNCEVMDHRMTSGVMPKVGAE